MYNKLAITLTALLISGTVHAAEKESALKHILRKKYAELHAIQKKIDTQIQHIQSWETAQEQLHKKMLLASQDQHYFVAQIELVEQCKREHEAQEASLRIQGGLLANQINDAHHLMAKLAAALTENNEEAADLYNKAIVGFLSRQK